jgi:hypothetical protein
MMHVEVGPTNLYNAGRGQLVKLEKTAGSSAGLLCAACADRVVDKGERCGSIVPRMRELSGQRKIFSNCPER